MSSTLAALSEGEHAPKTCLLTCGKSQPVSLSIPIKTLFEVWPHPTFASWSDMFWRGTVSRLQLAQVSEGELVEPAALQARLDTAGLCKG